MLNLSLLICCLCCIFTSSLQMKLLRNRITSALIASSLSFSVTSVAPAFGVETPSAAEATQPVSLEAQIKSIQYAQFATKKERVSKEEDAAIARELLYPPGKLVGRGTIRLLPQDITTSVNTDPFGLDCADLIDSSFLSEDSTLFVLAVGREGPPVAAKKYTNLKDIKFPIVTELTSDDLLFPYTASAWLESSNQKDTVAMTAILSTDGKLASSNPADRVGFGLSEPRTIAGVLGRTTGPVNVDKKIDISLYSDPEVEILSKIDAELDKRIDGGSKGNDLKKK